MFSSSKKASQKGQSLVEFALVFPLFIFLIFFAIEVAMLLRDKQSVVLLTGELARQVFIGKSDSDINANLNSIVTGVGLNSTSLNVSIVPNSSTRKSGDLVTISLSYPHELMFDALDLAQLLNANPYMLNSSTKTIVQ